MLPIFRCNCLVIEQMWKVVRKKKITLSNNLTGKMVRTIIKMEWKFVELDIIAIDIVVGLEEI